MDKYQCSYKSCDFACQGDDANKLYAVHLRTVHKWKYREIEVETNLKEGTRHLSGLEEP